jgi:uracil-DNA glycosylase
MHIIRPTLTAKPYVGSSPKVFLIGQDPTLVNRQIETVLEFEREDSPLRGYIEKEILAPLGFSLEDVYATNAVKCTFPGRTPAQWAKTKGVSVENILYPFFRRCKKYLTRELINLKPRIVIAFGQATHRLLISAYHWKINPDMKEVFGQAFSIHNPISTLYVPVIHYNSRRHQYYQTRWPAFLQEVSKHLEGGEKVRLAWLRRFPKRGESINGALNEVVDATRTLKEMREDMLSSEISCDYPQDERVQRYREQIACLEKALQHLNGAMAELMRYTYRT